MVVWILQEPLKNCPEAENTDKMCIFYENLYFMAVYGIMYKISPLGGNMRKLKRRGIILLTVCLMFVLSGCSEIKEIVDSYEAPTEPIKTTNENQYTVVRSEEEIYDMFLETMKSNKTTCYFNVADEAMIKPDDWAKSFDGIEEIKVEYTIAQSGFNVFVTLDYWDNYPIVAAFESNDTTILSATQLELFDKYCEILGACTSKSYTEYENELAIHDYLVSNVQYGGVEEEAYTAYDALIKGRAVCSGYQEAFKTLLDMLGIENMAVTGNGNGESHGWNMVKLDGEWYHVDVTWDDPIDGDGSISHKYFNVTDADMALDHIWVAEDYPKAEGTQYAYYVMSGMAQIHNQEELDAYIMEKVNAQAEKLEFVLYSEADVNQALQKPGISMSVSYNILKKTEFSVYDITISYN